jgi:hypothetical protein
MWQWMLMYINSREAAPGDYLLCQLHVSQKDMVLSLVFMLTMISVYNNVDMFSNGLSRFSVSNWSPVVCL